MDKTERTREKKSNKTVKTGILDYVFTSYDKLEARWKRSAVYRAAASFSISKPMSRFRRIVSRSVERSTFLRIISGYIGILPDVTLRAYGTFIFSLGLYSSLVYIIKMIASTLTSDIDTLITGVILMLVSIPLLLSGKTLSEAVLESRAGDLLAFEVLGFRREEAAVPRKRHKRCDLAMLGGMIFGLCSFYIDILDIVTALVSAAAAYFVLTRPEAGVILLFVFAAFLPTDILRIYILILYAGYFFKLLTGRRTLRFDAADTVMLLFLTVYYFGGVIHYGNGTDVGEAMYPSFIFVYFIITNVIKDDKWRGRVKYAVIVGGVLSALVFLLSRFFDTSMITADFSSSVLFELFSAIDAVVKDMEDIAPYFIMVFPMMTASVISRRGSGGFAVSLITTAVTLAAIVYTWSRGLWLGAAVGIVILFMAKNFNYIWIPIAGLITVTASLLFLPDETKNFVLGILDMSGAGTVNRISIRQTAAQILLDNPVGGIGSADGVFEAVYRTYAEFGETAPNSQSLFLNVAVELGVTGFILFIAAILMLFVKALSGAKNSEHSKEGITSFASAAGFASVLVSGLTSDIFYDEKMFLLFFIFAAFMSSYNTVRAKNNPENAVMNDTQNGKSASRDIEYR